MKLAYHNFGKIYIKTLGFYFEWDTDNPNIVGNPKWIFSFYIYLINWGYTLEIHSSESKET